MPVNKIKNTQKGSRSEWEKTKTQEEAHFKVPGRLEGCKRLSSWHKGAGMGQPSEKLGGNVVGGGEGLYRHSLVGEIHDNGAVKSSEGGSLNGKRMFSTTKHTPTKKKKKKN